MYYNSYSSWQLSIKSKLCYDRRPVGQSVFVSSPPICDLKTRFLLLSDSCGFVDVGRPLWRKDGSVVHNCCWSSPAHLFLNASPAGLIAIFYCHRFDTPPTWRTRSPYLYPPRKRVAHPGTGFPFRRLLRLAGLRWRYSNPPPRWDPLSALRTE
jgi:hypothetical protein